MNKKNAVAKFKGVNSEFHFISNAFFLNTSYLTATL